MHWPGCRVPCGSVTTLRRLRFTTATPEISPDDAYLVVLPAAHNFPLCCPGLLGVFATGGRVVFTDNPSPDNTFDLIERHRITVTALVPALAQVWCAATEWEPADISSLRVLQVGGAKLAQPDAEALDAALGPVVQQVFGMAEGLICYTRLDDDRTLVTTVQGRPMSEFDEVRVVDEDGHDVPDGTEGELLVRGPYTIRGYYRAPEHNARSFTSDGFYRSGDRVTRRPDGYLARQVRRWGSQWELVRLPDDPREADVQRLHSILAQSIPAQSRTSIVHGDYRIDNTILDAEDATVVRAVLDWEMSTLGDPLSDTALMCIYRDPIFGLVHAEAAWASEKIPAADELAHRYSLAAGQPLRHWDFYMALACFKLAIIAAGIDYRFRAGSGEAAAGQVGQAVAPLIAQGLSYVA